MFSLFSLFNLEYIPEEAFKSCTLTNSCWVFFDQSLILSLICCLAVPRGLKLLKGWGRLDEKRLAAPPSESLSKDCPSESPYWRFHMNSHTWLFLKCCLLCFHLVFKCFRFFCVCWSWNVKEIIYGTFWLLSTEEVFLNSVSCIHILSVLYSTSQQGSYY